MREIVDAIVKHRDQINKLTTELNEAFKIVGDRLREQDKQIKALQDSVVELQLLGAKEDKNDA